MPTSKALVDVAVEMRDAETRDQSIVANDRSIVPEPVVSKPTSFSEPPWMRNALVDVECWASQERRSGSWEFWDRFA